MPQGDTSIVEVGSWLGAGTAQLALGLRAREHADVRLHCFDRWTAQLGEVRKAARQGVRLKLFQDTLPYVRRTLEQFEVPLELHQGDVMRARWDGGPISVYVDDCCKQLPLFCHSLATFGPAWIPGETVVLLMDFSMDHQTFQRRFVAAAGRCFEPIELLDEAASRTPLAMFRYKNSLGPREWAWLLEESVQALVAAKREPGVVRLRRDIQNALRFIVRIAGIGQTRSISAGCAEVARRLRAKLLFRGEHSRRRGQAAASDVDR